MTTVSTYLTFKGNCETAFKFYRMVFGGEFAHIGRFKDMPQDDPNCVIDDSEKNNIMHVSFPIGNSILMGSDAGGGWTDGITIGNNFSVSINTDSKDEADRLFNALSKNGKKTMPMSNTFWGSYFGMFTDQFDIQWMVSFDANPQNN